MKPGSRIKHLAGKAKRLIRGNTGTWKGLRYFLLFGLPVRTVWVKVGARKSIPNLVSVIIPTYNRHAMLREAVQSVQRQTVSDWEVIVVSDGADPLVEDLVASFQDPRITYLHTRRSATFGNHQRNIGILAARGQYFLFLDDDNWLEPHALEMMRSGFSEPDIRYVIAPIFYSGLGLDHQSKVVNEIWFPLPPFREAAVHNHGVDSLNFMLTREALYRGGPWKRYIWADFLLISTVERAFRGARVNGPPIGSHRADGASDRTSRNTLPSKK